MKTKASIDSSLHWTEHYVHYGFAVLEGLVDREFCAEAVEAVRRIVGTDLPLEEWTVDNVRNPTGPVLAPEKKTDGAPVDPHSPRAVLHRIYDQPHLRAAIDTMFGSPDRFNGNRSFQLFVKQRDPRAEPFLSPVGHVDYGSNKTIPALGSGFVFQVSLVDKEPFGGNILIYPGTHRHVQRCIMNDPDWGYPKNWDDIPLVEPFEFVAEAGDVLFFSHLVGHEASACTTLMPRVSLHCQAMCDEWLEEIDPSKLNLSPWERNFALNGYCRINEKEARLREQFLQQTKAA